ncbi:hypothetical protein CEXT_535311 [Caerostris extrusa]|uniref:Uncharacterized protein n=1 Tax=Caerostris extrusa TaxID=172846 RepID=A0AAV4WTR5_CAEEX|nr:hypothetical protein CEXT_535311 [Caerostris extrusa]
MHLTVDLDWLEHPREMGLRKERTAFDFLDIFSVFSHGHRIEQDDPEECRCAVCQEENEQTIFGMFRGRMGGWGVVNDPEW